MQRLFNYYSNNRLFCNRVLSGFAVTGALGSILLIMKYVKYNRDKERSFQSLRKQSELQQNTICNPIDHCSLSNIHEIVTQHSDLFIKIDFENKILIGKSILRMKAIKNCEHIRLDLSCLNIIKVQLNNNLINFKVRQELVPALGGQLEIQKIIKENEIITLEIDFETIPNPKSQVGLNWLESSQTFTGKSPFLFSQCEPIYARSIFPCQDSPSIKSTYNFTFTVPQQFKAYGSGILIRRQEGLEENLFEFQQKNKIPSYLVSICAGELAEKKIGNRTSVISEPSMIDRCAYEFEEMENFLVAIEQYISPYKWQEFNAVILPKSFPFGGMENPNLTFLSPSLIVGDRSCVSVMIHEMVHSWSGNGVTCQNWECFWLNEGITVFFERETIKKLYGEQIYRLESVLGNISMRNAIKNFGENHTYTSLSPKINQENPDDCFSAIPYEKGYQYLRYLQKQIGENEFQGFMRKVVQNEVLNAYEFKKQLEEFIHSKGLNINILWNEWVVKEGYPPMSLEFEEEVNNHYQDLAQKVYDRSLGLDDFNKLVSQEKCYILDLLNEMKLTQQVLSYLDDDLNLFENKNPEILKRVLIMGIRCDYMAAQGNILTEFLQCNGRMKFILPIYRTLSQYKQALGLHLFNQCKSGYHSIAIGQINRMYQQN